MGLVLLLDAAQDLDRVLDARLADEDLLETALEGRVLLDPLAVLVERGRTDHPQLTACEHRLQHVAGVHGGVAAGAGADDRVQLVDERDHLAAGVLDLLQHGLEPLLELTAVLRARHHRGQVQREQPPALQRVRDVARDDPLGEPLDDGGLADARLTDQHGVVLGPARQHLDHAPDLGVTTDDRVELAVLGGRGEVDGVLLEALVRRLRLLARHPAVAAHGGQPFAQPVGGEADLREQLLRSGLDGRQADQQVLGGDVVVLHRGGEVERAGQDAGQGGRGGGLLDRGPGGLGQREQGGLGPSGEGRGVGAALGDQLARRTVGIAQQGDEQVDRLGLGVARRGRGELGGLDRLPAAGGELLGPELAHASSFALVVRWVVGATVALTCSTIQKLSRFPSTL